MSDKSSSSLLSFKLSYKVELEIELQIELVNIKLYFIYSKKKKTYKSEDLMQVYSMCHCSHI